MMKGVLPEVLDGRYTAIPENAMSAHEEQPVDKAGMFFLHLICISVTFIGK
jgi:hypothetical protein